MCYTPILNNSNLNHFSKSIKPPRAKVYRSKFSRPVIIKLVELLLIAN